MINQIINADCIDFMKQYKNGGGTVNITLTDIPFGVVNKKSNGLRVIDKGYADNINFELDEFLNLVYDITIGTVIIFCAKEQLSQIYKFFAAKQGTTRQLIWQKSIFLVSKMPYGTRSAAESSTQGVKIQFSNSRTAEVNYIRQRRTMT